MHFFIFTAVFGFEYQAMKSKKIAQNIWSVGENVLRYSAGPEMCHSLAFGAKNLTILYIGAKKLACAHLCSFVSRVKWPLENLPKAQH